MASPLASVEIFHLIFLRTLTAKGEDKSLYALKGGCNLRFYFGSVRFSEDIDLDVTVVAKDTLQRKVDRLLAGPNVRAPLAAQRIEIAAVSSPKQTETTQRWKVALSIDTLAEPVRTKIEFSRRRSLLETSFERVDLDVLRRHGMPPFAATHYPAHAAIAQKIEALAGRAAPQARDVFDLQLLLARRDATAPPPKGILDMVPRAIENAMGISFDDYRAQVISYLDPHHSDPYASAEAWETMQTFIVDRLGEWAR